jgi:hypothetical protein
MNNSIKLKVHIKERRRVHEFHSPATETPCDRGSYEVTDRFFRLSVRDNGDPESTGVCTPANDSTEGEGEDRTDADASSSTSSHESSKSFIGI